METRSVYVILALGVVICLVQLSSCKDQVTLRKDLWNMSYGMHQQESRPVRNESEPVTIYFGVSLIHLNQLDMDSKVMESHVWLRFLWRDFRLKWDPRDYGGINRIRVDYRQLWKPDITLFNSLVPNVDVSNDVLAIVYYTGDVLWIPRANLKSVCFDDSETGGLSCPLRFASWTYDGSEIVPDFYEGQESVDVSDYAESPRWNLVSYEAVKNVFYYPCCMEPYLDLTYNLKFTPRG